MALLLCITGNRLRKQISILEETCEARTEESNHMKALVTQMEAAPGQEEQNKVQIADLKTELAKAEGAIYFIHISFAVVIIR